MNDLIKNPSRVISRDKLDAVTLIAMRIRSDRLLAEVLAFFPCDAVGDALAEIYNADDLARMVAALRKHGALHGDDCVANKEAACDK